ncbi:hypothetical protein [Nocardioides dongkuii]|uniref:hypothetical protein n=1 Tax=Nocardioides dongkuii TaxID=2760089 RepID=UPI0015FC4018|nr:hypothetical protein [Nocardioides dongkuii]
MFESNVYAKSEMDYRSSRIRAGVRSRRHGHGRAPRVRRVRRPSVPVEDAR